MTRPSGRTGKGLAYIQRKTVTLARQLLTLRDRNRRSYAEVASACYEGWGKQAITVDKVIEIREAQFDDVPALARVHVQADWDTYAPLFGCRAFALDPTESELRWRRALSDGDTLLVASDGREIVGFGHARGARIGALYLLRSRQRRGIGKALLSALLAALNKRGVAEARFDVVARNEAAIAFYLSCGAYRVGETINRDRRGDTTDVALRFPLVVMFGVVWRGCQ